MEIGDTFLLIDKSIDEHLWVVISDPGQDHDRVVIVNLTSDSPEKDRSCILVFGDHPWVTHDTCVRYRDARISSEADLDKLVAAGALVPQEAASDEMLAKIFEGTQRTDFLPGKCREILEQQDLIVPF